MNFRHSLEDRYRSGPYCITDGEEGLWVTWQDEDGVKVTRFNDEASIRDGWGRDGFIVWGSDIVNGIEAVSIFPNGDLALIADKFLYSPVEQFMRSATSYYLQHLSEHPRQSVEDRGSDSPTVFRIENNYPNPFNSVTYLSFTTPSPGDVEVQIYDTIGRLGHRKDLAYLQAGLHRYAWQGCDNAGKPLSTSIYYIELTFQSAKLVRRLVMLK